MSTRSIRWLYRELPELVRSGVLDREAAERIERHYGPVAETTARGLLVPVFGVLGALLIGAGVMLLVGHNWEELGRPLRAGLSFGLLLGAQALAGWTLWRHPRSIAWSEGSGVFLGLAIGATIALIAQTYQLPGNLESFMLTWTLLALPIPYLLRSRVGAGLYWILATCWLTANPWAAPVGRQAGIYLLLIGFIAPFMAWLIRRHARDIRTVLLLWTATVCVVIAGCNVLSRLSYGLWLPLATAFFGALYVAGLARNERAGVDGLATWRRPLHVVGATGLAVMLFTGGFAEVWREAVGATNRPSSTTVTVVACAAVMLLLAVSTWRGIVLWRRSQMHRAYLAFAPVLLTAIWAVSFRSGTEGWLMLAVNVLGIGIGVATVHSGIRGGNLGTANCGLLLAVALIVARFFDEDWSFVVRGVGFIIMGIVFLAMNLWLLRRRREVQA